MKILIVEDNEENQSLFLRLLNNKGKTYTANNGRIGLERVKEIQPGLIIMDMEMPVMTGYEAVRILRKQGYKGVIVGCTADIKPDSTLYAGCDRVILKPFDIDEFIKIIENLISHIRATDQEG